MTIEPRRRRKLTDAQLDEIGFAREHLSATAHHEAGHCVASWAMDRENGQSLPTFHRVHITRPEDVIYPHPEFPKGSKIWGWVDNNQRRCDQSRPDAERVIMEADCIELFSGPLAESSPTLNPWPRTKGSPDLARCAKLNRPGNPSVFPEWA